MQSQIDTTVQAAGPVYETAMLGPVGAALTMWPGSTGHLRAGGANLSQLRPQMSKQADTIGYERCGALH